MDTAAAPYDSSIDKDVKLEYDQPDYPDLDTIYKETQLKIDNDMTIDRPEWMTDLEMYEGWLNRLKDLKELRDFANETGVLLDVDMNTLKNISKLLRSGDPTINFTELVSNLTALMAKYQPFFASMNNDMVIKINYYKDKMIEFYSELKAHYDRIMSRIQQFRGKIVNGYELLEDSDLMEMHVRSKFKSVYSASEVAYINYGVKLTLWQRLKTYKWTIKGKILRVIRKGFKPKINMKGKESAMGTGAELAADLGVQLGGMLYDELQQKRLQKEVRQLNQIIDQEFETLSPRQRIIFKNIHYYSDKLNDYATVLMHYFRDRVKTKADEKLSNLTKKQVVSAIKTDNAKKHTDMTLPNSNYEGPGNYLYSGTPVDKADEVALKHDWHYHLSQYQEDISEADVQAIEEFGAIYEQEKSFTSFVGWLGIRAKKFIEDHIVGHVIYPVRPRRGETAPRWRAEPSGYILGSTKFTTRNTWSQAPPQRPATRRPHKTRRRREPTGDRGSRGSGRESSDSE